MEDQNPQASILHSSAYPADHSVPAQGYSPNDEATQATVDQVMEAQEATVVNETSAPVPVMPVRMFAVTLGNDYQEDSPAYSDPQYRQIYYYHARNEAEVVNKLKESYPELSNYTVTRA